MKGSKNASMASFQALSNSGMVIVSLSLFIAGSRLVLSGVWGNLAGIIIQPVINGNSMEPAASAARSHRQHTLVDVFT
ncbi:MAG TPA: hypothetical protein VF278_12175, partial [Pirellulales bacterium]